MMRRRRRWRRCNGRAKLHGFGPLCSERRRMSYKKVVGADSCTCAGMHIPVTCGAGVSRRPSGTDQLKFVLSYFAEKPKIMSAGNKENSAGYCTGKDMLLLPDGSTYHLGTKAGDLFPRILTVGAQKRAAAIATLFDKDKPVKEVHSSREFHTYSGYFKGVGVSIIAIGMGAPMMDFMVREATFVQPGPMAIIRLGTCGLFKEDLIPGTVVTGGKGSMYVYVNYSHFWGCANDPSIGKNSPPYLISAPVPCDKTLNELLTKALKTDGVTTRDGLNACGETFYGCQGRKDPLFDDRNTEIMPVLMKNGVDFVEMETHQLFHLANIRKDPCHVAGAAIGIVNRVNDNITANISVDDLHKLEVTAGRACLQALIDFKL